ncbi:cobalamin biosynthesis protein [Aedoeadaptatus ivorii]|uniref:Cobalamin biosynthesis protein CobD n=1 Tax=Aedoeadaptatus ivorii TaxID=54006 RepID=A0A448V132_9FIRM|nr:adenosylcobinamide-phosphate synthase CbiB [Peptoniphilus ivorii]VEJ35429.1 cobalamin biosynthesis protein [Peptoniphilus ivorii]
MYILIAFLLDIVFGDPEGMVHPVRGMGRWIEFVYKKITALPQDRQRTAGIVAAFGSVFGAFFLVQVLLLLLPAPLDGILSVYLLYTSLAAKNLAEEAMAVHRALEESLEAARRQLSRIVGRETAALKREEVICAVVETVSENTSDGVIAPLLYAFLFGPAGAVAYKMANTLDSMVGYRNETYRDAGYGAAKLDDILNWIPARLTVAVMAISTGSGFAMVRAFKSAKRYGRNHLSPNAGYPESAAAGILGIRLGGGHYYFGEYVEKPYIGEAVRTPTTDDIVNAVGLLWRSSLLFMLIGHVLYWIVRGI